MTNSNILRQSIFSLAPNHEELVVPLSAQSNNPLVDIAIKVYGAGGTITRQKMVTSEDGKTYYTVIGSFLGTSLVETVVEGENEVSRYSPLYGYLNSGENLPESLYNYVGQSLPIPPNTNVTILLSVEDIESVNEMSQGNSIGVSSGFHNNSQNVWVIKAQVHLHQAITIICPRSKDLETGEVNGFRRVPSFLIPSPIKLEAGVNIMGYSNFNGGFPQSQLTTQEVNHPLIAYLLQLITENAEYGYNQSGKNGSRAYAPTARNEFFESKSKTPLQRTYTPTTPSQFMNDSEDDAQLVSVGSSSTSTPLTNRSYQ